MPGDCCPWVELSPSQDLHVFQAQGLLSSIWRLRLDWMGDDSAASRGQNQSGGDGDSCSNRPPSHGDPDWSHARRVVQLRATRGKSTPERHCGEHKRCAWLLIKRQSRRVLAWLDTQLKVRRFKLFWLKQACQPRRDSQPTRRGLNHSGHRPGHRLVPGSIP